MTKLAPIALFVYNRFGTTKKTVEALKKNYLASQSELFIFSDGAKNSGSIESVKKVRHFIKTIKGFKRVTIIERKTNYGLSKSVIDGVTQIINKFGKIIVLEDDLVTSQYFLSFMNESLNTYAAEEKVASVHGYIYPIKALPELFFIRGADCWGWATWKNRWQLFEPNGQALLDKLIEKKLEKEANFNNSYSFSNMLRQQINGKNDSWAVRWYFSMFLLDKVTLYPGKSYVQNIGFDGQGTNSTSKDNLFTVDLNHNNILKQKLEILESDRARLQIEKFFKSIKPSIVQRIWRKIIKPLKV